MVHVIIFLLIVAQLKDPRYGQKDNTVSLLKLLIALPKIITGVDDFVHLMFANIHRKCRKLLPL